MDVETVCLDLFSGPSLTLVCSSLFPPVFAVTAFPALKLQRVTTNVTFFATNYLLICALCSAFYIIRSPGLLVTLMLSLSMFVYVFMSRRKPLVLFDVSLGTREKMIGALAGLFPIIVLRFPSY